MDETKGWSVRADEDLPRTMGRSLQRLVKKGWLVAAASCMVPIAQADAQEPPPATAPSGVTTIVPPAPAPAAPDAPAALPVAPPTSAPPAASAPPPSVVLVPAPSAPPPPAPAPVEAPKPAWSPVFTGSFFTRYELRSGFDDLGLSTNRARFQEGDAMFYRARFGIGTGLFEVAPKLKVGLQFTPQATGTFGSLPNTVTDLNLNLHEGYGRVQGQYVRVDAGRFELNYGDALIIGNLDWNEVGRTFDGLRARIATSPTSAWVDIFATQIREGRPDSTRISDGDVYFLGAYGAFGPAITKGLDLDFYALTRIWGDQKNTRVVAANPTPTYRKQNAAEATFGLRAKQKLGMLDYRLETGLQAGSRPGAAPAATATAPVPEVENVKVLAYHADAEVGVSFAKDKLRAGVEGLIASGDKASSRKNEGFDELFPTAHKFLGLSDAFVQGGIKRTNVASGVLHLTAMPTKMLTLQVDGHIFSRLEKSAATNNHEGFAGGELDVGAVVLLGKGLKLRGTYAIFIPDSGIYRDVLPVPALAKSADPVQFAELELRFDI